MFALLKQEPTETQLNTVKKTAEFLQNDPNLVKRINREHSFAQNSGESNGNKTQDSSNSSSRVDEFLETYVDRDSGSHEDWNRIVQNFSHSKDIRFLVGLKMRAGGNSIHPDLEVKLHEDWFQMIQNAEPSLFGQMIDLLHTPVSTEAHLENESRAIKATLAIASEHNEQAKREYTQYLLESRNQNPNLPWKAFATQNFLTPHSNLYEAMKQHEAGYERSPASH